MNPQTHWQQIYKTKSPEDTSWHQPHLRTSLDWIEEAANGFPVSIIDIGTGESTLIDDLLAKGYGALTVLDIAGEAIKKSQERLGAAATTIHWLTGDVTTIPLPKHVYDLWHDRAVFHFLTGPEQRQAYVQQLRSALKDGGQAIMATFGPNGPATCSGLDTVRYDPTSLHRELGSGFQLVRSSIVEHRTPFGGTQEFLYCHFSFDSLTERHVL